MLHRLIVILRIASLIGSLALGGVIGCTVLGALAPTLDSAPSAVLGGMMGFAFVGGMGVTGAILYVIFGDRVLPL